MNTRAQPDAGRTGHGPPAWLVSAGGRGAPLTAKQDRDRAALAHLSLAFGVLGPLVVWLLYRDRGPFTAQESKEALNFTLPPTLLALTAWLLSLVPDVGGIFAVVNALIWVAITIFSVNAGIQVNRGRPYRYALNLRLIR